ncbi:MAG TPA: YqiA/YcfP family alpha/beta fold hydrolase [Acidiferrobacterales bacterium]|nr:YqiA/YcfP family alpha/beta fold hydrolase [Acidiferrobacterales bacterium]
MIIYLHGFNSGGQSQKAAWLRAQLAPVPVFAPDYPAHRANETLRVLRKFIRRLRRENPHTRKLMLIGSSLGGFWAQRLAPEFGACMVLINPSMRPDETLARHTGRHRNAATGGETVLTAQDVLALKAQRVEPCNPKVPTLVLLDAQDEVLDYRLAEAAFRGCGRSIVFPGGSHRFEHLPEALSEIRALYAG